MLKELCSSLVKWNEHLSVKLNTPVLKLPELRSWHIFTSAILFPYAIIPGRENGQLWKSWYSLRIWSPLPFPYGQDVISQQEFLSKCPCHSNHTYLSLHNQGLQLLFQKWIVLRENKNKPENLIHHLWKLIMYIKPKKWPFKIQLPEACKNNLEPDTPHRVNQIRNGHELPQIVQKTFLVGWSFIRTVAVAQAIHGAGQIQSFHLVLLTLLYLRGYS